MADLVQYYGTGRRKSAIARVFLRPGSGNFKVNEKALEAYFVTEQQRVSAVRPLVLTELTATFDVVTTVKGGGVSAQADGLLSRDARAKERKKYGQKGARKRFQFSKR
jgi:small subunit ribosomal protein S9